MTRTVVAALLAIAAALMVAVGDVLEQRSAQQVTNRPVRTVASSADCCAIAGVGGQPGGRGRIRVQAAALGLGSVVLVQALLVTSLLFALLINAGTSHHRITRVQGIWAVLLHCRRRGGGYRWRPQQGTPRGSLRAWAVVAAVMGSGDILCLIGARIFSSAVKALLLGVISGSLWDLFSV